MRTEEARALLGVGATATAAEIRAAWRRSVRGAHPDVTAGPEAGVRTARLNEAYAVLRDLPPASPVPVPAAAPPPVDRFLALLDAAHRTGDVTYVDRASGLLELLVDVPDVGSCSVLVTLQGHPDGTVHAAVTAESLAHPGWRPDRSLLERLARSLAG